MDFDTNINAYVVSLPDYVYLKELKEWGLQFLMQLEDRGEIASLLFDTNQHIFESVECLKYLRDLLSKNLITKEYISRTAFVQPLETVQAHIVSDREAYFSNIEEALAWLH